MKPFIFAQSAADEAAWEYSDARHAAGQDSVRIELFPLTARRVSTRAALNPADVVRMLHVAGTTVAYFEYVSDCVDRDMTKMALMRALLVRYARDDRWRTAAAAAVAKLDEYNTVERVEDFVYTFSWFPMERAEYDAVLETLPDSEVDLRTQAWRTVVGRKRYDAFVGTGLSWIEWLERELMQELGLALVPNAEWDDTADEMTE